MFSKKDKKVQDIYFEKNYSKGFNVGVGLVNNVSPELKTNTKELIHLMVLAKPKDLIFQGMFSGYCFQLERERSQKRLQEIEQINEMAKSREKNLSR